MNISSSPRQPLILLGVAAVGGILAAEFVPAPIEPLFIAIVLMASACLIRPAGWLSYFLTAAVFYTLHLVQQTYAPGKELSTRVGDTTRVVSVTGTVQSEPKISPNEFMTFLLQLDTIEIGGDTIPCIATVRVRWKGNPKLGDRLKVTGVIEPIPPPRNPGEFDMRAYLARRDVYNGVFVRYSEDGTILQTGMAGLVWASAARARDWMRVTLTRGLEDSPDVGGLIDGLVLGLRHETPDDIEEPFQQTGTLHLFAVAGLHVGIVAQLLWIFALLLRLPRRVAAGLIIPCLFFYSAITGFHVSSVRAATMAGVLLGGIFFDRPALALNSLAGAALLILAVDPNQLFSSGFQLSFAVVGAILISQQSIYRFLLRPSESDPFLPRSLVSRSRRAFEKGYGWLAGGVSVSTAAWIGSLVLIMWYFYLVTPISLVANLAVVPVAFCVLAVALMSLVVAPFSTSLSVVFNNANWSLSNLIFGCVQAFAVLPGGHLYVARPQWPSGVRAEITVLDIGAGAAVHIRAGGTDWLFDTGSSRDYEKILRGALHSRGVNRLDGLLLSHGDSLHIGGAASVLAEFNPGRIIDNGAPDRSRIHQALSGGKEREFAACGTIFPLSKNVTAHVLYPIGFKAKAADDQTLVVQLIIEKKFRVLLLSDSGSTTENALLQLVPPNELRSDILIKGQHYSGASGTPAFLDAVQPQLIVATSRDFPARERIPDEWASGLRDCGIALYRQDQTGAVRLEFFQREWRATPFVGQTVFRSASR
jgi:competence protein ComEC